MANHAVENRRSERQTRLRPSLHFAPDLPQPEQVKMVDHKSAEQDQPPTEREPAVEQQPGGAILNLPHRPAHRPPLPKENSFHDRSPLSGSPRINCGAAPSGLQLCSATAGGAMPDRRHNLLERLAAADSFA